MHKLTIATDCICLHLVCTTGAATGCRPVYHDIVQGQIDRFNRLKEISHPYLLLSAMVSFGLSEALQWRASFPKEQSMVMLVSFFLARIIFQTV